MSQYSPPPPPGQPPLGQMGYSLPAMTRTSGAAVCSLVCGLVMCVPGVTGLVAIITGLIGIAETGKPAVRGRGMAIAGLILGILSLAGWGAVGGGAYAMFRATKPQRDFAKAFVKDLYAGRIDQCVQNSTVNLNRDVLDAASGKMRNWGRLAYQGTTILAVAFKNPNGDSSASITGFCRFSGEQHGFVMTLVQDSSGQFKADSFAWRN